MLINIARALKLTIVIVQRVDGITFEQCKQQMFELAREGEKKQLETHTCDWCFCTHQVNESILIGFRLVVTKPCGTDFIIA